MNHQVIEGFSRKLEVVVRGVVTDLVQVGIGLVGDAFAVSVDINTGEGRCLD